MEIHTFHATWVDWFYELITGPVLKSQLQRFNDMFIKLAF